jgi:hypothetical protein
MQCEYFALEGLSDLVNTIKQVHANLNPALEVIGILRVMFDARITLQSQVSEQLKAHFGDKVFDTVIPRNVRLAEAPSYGLPGVVFTRLKARSPSRLRARDGGAGRTGCAEPVACHTGATTPASGRVAARVETPASPAPREQRWSTAGCPPLARRPSARCIQAVAPRLDIDAKACPVPLSPRRGCIRTCASRRSAAGGLDRHSPTAAGASRRHASHGPAILDASGHRIDAGASVRLKRPSPKLRRLGRSARGSSASEERARRAHRRRRSPTPFRGDERGGVAAGPGPSSRARSPASTTSHRRIRAGRGRERPPAPARLRRAGAPGYLQVDAGNDVARRIYRRLGFVAATYHYRTPPEGP